MAQTMARMAESGRAKIKEVGLFLVFYDIYRKRKYFPYKILSFYFVKLLIL